MRFFGISQARGRRSVPRTLAPLEALLSTPAADHSAELLDLSRTGARLGAVCFLDEGQQVMFRAEKVRAAAEVVWIDGGECGVEFDTPIAADEVKRIRALAKFVTAVGSGR